MANCKRKMDFLQGWRLAYCGATVGAAEGMAGRRVCRLSAFFRRASPIRYSLQTLLSDESDLSDSSDTHFRSKWRSRSASATGSQRPPRLMPGRGRNWWIQCCPVNQALSLSRRATRRILPLTVLGSSVINSTMRGYLYGAV